jgi:hypothetical protein
MTLRYKFDQCKLAVLNYTEIVGSPSCHINQLQLASVSIQPRLEPY